MRYMWEQRKIQAQKWSATTGAVAGHTNKISYRCFTSTENRRLFHRRQMKNGWLAQCLTKNFMAQVKVVVGNVRTIFGVWINQAHREHWLSPQTDIKYLLLLLLLYLYVRLIWNANACGSLLIDAHRWATGFWKQWTLDEAKPFLISRMRGGGSAEGGGGGGPGTVPQMECHSTSLALAHSKRQMSELYSIQTPNNLSSQK